MKGKTTKRDHRRRNLATAVILGVMGAVAAEPAFAQDIQQTSDERIEFDIAAQPLSSALSEFARQARVNALYFSDDLQRLPSSQLRGAYTRQQALDLLLARSGYNGRISGGNLLLAQEQPSRPQQESAANGAETTPASDAAINGRESDEEIVVTGTRIRGQAPVGANVITVDRQEIEESGLSTGEQLIRALPQAYGGGFAQNVGFSFGNTGGGSGINLRGLGADATLTLVNNRRLPVMGTNSNFVDISSIPVTAIERIEVLPDSASAIYGSDAVGGVVNFVLRQDFEGAELRLRHGAVTHGGLHETRVAGAAGHDFGPLNVFVAVEHFERSALSMQDRDYLANSDLRRFGGSDFRLLNANPANLIISGLGARPVPSGQDGSDLSDADVIAGPLNMQNQNEALDALPESSYDAIYTAARWGVAPNLEVYGEARFVAREYSQRGSHVTQRITIPSTNAFRTVNNLFAGRTLQADYDFTRDLGPRIDFGDMETVDLAAGATFHLGDDWSFEPSLSYSRVGGNHRLGLIINSTALIAALASSDPDVAFNPFGDGSFTNPATLAKLRGYTHNNLESEVWSTALKADGTLFDLPAGSVRTAFGVDYRQEFFEIAGETFSSGTAPAPRVSSSNGRSVSAIYGELLLPVVGNGFLAQLGERFDLSLAVRHERYSDFGGTTNPKLGLVYEPVTGLSFRANWGQSFRAPNLSDLDTDNFSGRRLVRAQNQIDPGAPSGRSNAILVFGANPDLTEQRAQSWSAGITIDPPTAPGLRFDAGYFDVQFSDRIGRINNLVVALTPGSEFSALVNRAPDDALITALLAEANLQGTGGGFNVADISVVVDVRSQNLAVTNINGFDVATSWNAADVLGGELELSASATYIIAFERAVTPAAPVLDVAGTFGNPTNLRGRFGATWRNDAYSLAAFANYTGRSEDRLSSPARDIDEWITVDLTASAALWGGGGPRLTLSATNVFDENPPFVNNGLGIGYDPANADPLGRFVAIEIAQRF